MAAAAAGLLLACLLIFLSIGGGVVSTTQALAVLGLFCCLMLPGLVGHLPNPGLGLANRITLGRAAGVALLAGMLGQGQPAPIVAWMATGLTLWLLILDGFDGWAARRQGTCSEFGARFDMETDALLILVLSGLVLQYGKAGPWVLLGGALRYLFIAATLALPWMRRPLPPSRRRQTACVLQIAALLICLPPVLQPPASTLLAAGSLAMLTLSFGVDVVWLARRARPASG
jgi:phosphatidylglycerophosphate synthase